MTNIEQTILKANLDEICDPQHGDCVSVAAGIRDVYGGSPLIFYTSEDQTEILHAVVEMSDGTLYDSTGRCNFTMLLNDAISEATEQQNEVIDERLFSYEEDLTEFDLYDQDIKRKVSTALSSTV